MTKISEDFQKMMDQLPIILSPSFSARLNEPVTIFKGIFEVVNGGKVVKIDGEIYFTWTPESGIKFIGVPDRSIFFEPIDKILIPGLDISHGYSYFIKMNGNGVVGAINSPFLIIHNQQDVDRIHFELPNFRDFLGAPVQVDDWMRTNRLTFENKDWLVTVDKISNYGHLKEELEHTGGYALLLTGELQHKSGKLNANRMHNMVQPLGLFFSFLNGRRTFPCFIQGLDQHTPSWTDFSANHADRYKSVGSWLPQSDHSGIGVMWDAFVNMTSDASSLECIDYLLHWYVEANNNSGFCEGAIVLLQNAFELLFNWQMIEQRNLYTVAKGKSINAAEKIRILLRDAGISLNIPIKYKEIENQLRSHQMKFQDFPELFTLVRNSITHTNQNKRTNLAKIPSLTRHHIKEIGICHLELLLLKLFNYQGKFASRISENMFVGGNEESVPWNKAVS
ncbi:hypothetical protein [Pedobacter sp. V48]|uniref:hypothetical protein n=1 Tax=Pedobacter sp. V48 TaxID=509635 RepID=UPI0003E4678B|nr:hypothetical protein [Pedobacter sp. V48]ETZ22856.1 hypothetical protein N824_21440 [Pedobacter sp. V48]